MSHDVILHKLKHLYEIDGTLLIFIQSYLMNRTQKVVVGGSCSNPLKVHSGVPQGSVLGPTLFVLFINDMISCVSADTNIALYADDTKIWRRIESWSDHQQLQEDISSLYRWSITNKMVFHPNKCKVLVVTLKDTEPILPFDRFGYHLNGTFLDYVGSQKDLGVLMTNKLAWGSQCKKLVVKARSRLGMVTRTLHYVRNKNQKRVFYLSLVRSLFEHCSVIWRPYTSTDVESLHMLQKRAVKWILSEYTASYSDREFLTKQHQLDLLPLDTRLKFTDLILFHHIVYKTVNIDMAPYLLLQSPELVRYRNPGSSASGERVPISGDIDEANIIVPNDHLQFKCTRHPKVDSFKYCFFHRVYKEWNLLPLSLRETQDPLQYKALLRDHLWMMLLERPD